MRAFQVDDRYAHGQMGMTGKRMDQKESGMTFQMDDGKAIWKAEESVLTQMSTDALFRGHLRFGGLSARRLTYLFASFCSQAQAAARVSSMLRSAFHPSSLLAREGSAQMAVTSPLLRGAKR